MFTRRFLSPFFRLENHSFLSFNLLRKSHSIPKIYNFYVRPAATRLTFLGQKWKIILTKLCILLNSLNHGSIKNTKSAQELWVLPVPLNSFTKISTMAFLLQVLQLLSDWFKSAFGTCNCYSIVSNASRKFLCSKIKENRSGFY
jgi:hypothetical protein